MNASRRDFLRVSLGASGALTLSLALPSLMRGAPPAPDFAPNAFIRIGTDNTVTLIMPNTEVGQGIYTSAAMLIAEELEVGLDQIRLEAAPPNNALYADPGLGEQATGGSASIRGDWVRLREAGAAARIMLVAAAAQRWNVPASGCTASRATVTDASTGRTLPYSALIADAATQPIPNKPPLKARKDFKLIGTAQRRLDTPSKVNGTAIFGIDIRVPGMKIGTVRTCPVRGGKLAGFDEAAARAVKGVHDIVPFADGLAVIGDHMWAAMQGAQAANPRWDAGAGAHVGMHDILADLDSASQSTGVIAKSVGNVDQAIDSARAKIDVVYQLPFYAHAPMEPINTTLHIRPDGADLWVGTQVPVRAQQTVARIAGLKPEQVTVHNQLMGGAFGRRLDVDSIEQAAVIAKTLGYPVKIIWTREEDIQRDLYRPYYYDRVVAAIGDNGTITGWRHRVTGSSVMARWYPPGMEKDGKLDPDAVEGAVETPYALPAHHVEYVRAEPQVVQTAWWRGVGPTHNVFVVESVVDELAHAADTDPVTFRRALLASNPRAKRVLDHVVEKSGYGTPLPRGEGRGVAVQFAFDTYVATVLHVAVSDQGEITVRRVDMAVDCGPVVNPDTVAAQMQGGMIFGLSSALYSEITLKDGRIEQSNFHDYRILRMNEAPDIRVFIVDNPDDKIGGIGETGTVAAAPALANAIFAATGRRLRTIPFAKRGMAGA